MQRLLLPGLLLLYGCGKKKHCAKIKVPPNQHEEEICCLGGKPLVKWGSGTLRAPVAPQGCCQTTGDAAGLAKCYHDDAQAARQRRRDAAPNATVATAVATANATGTLTRMVTTTAVQTLIDLHVDAEAQVGVLRQERARDLAPDGRAAPQLRLRPHGPEAEQMQLELAQRTGRTVDNRDHVLTASVSEQGEVACRCEYSSEEKRLQKIRSPATTICGRRKCTPVLPAGKCGNAEVWSNCRIFLLDEPGQTAPFWSPKAGAGVLALGLALA